MTEAFAQQLIASDGIQATGHPDGFCLRFGGEVVEVFPSFIGVKKGKLIADEALTMLADCLRRKV